MCQGWYSHYVIYFSHNPQRRSDPAHFYRCESEPQALDARAWGETRRNPPACGISPISHRQAVQPVACGIRGSLLTFPQTPPSSLYGNQRQVELCAPQSTLKFIKW